MLLPIAICSLGCLRCPALLLPTARSPRWSLRHPAQLLLLSTYRCSQGGRHPALLLLPTAGCSQGLGSQALLLLLLLLLLPTARCSQGVGRPGQIPTTGCLTGTLVIPGGPACPMCKLCRVYSGCMEVSIHTVSWSGRGGVGARRGSEGPHPWGQAWGSSRGGARGVLMAARSRPMEGKGMQIRSGCRSRRQRGHVAGSPSFITTRPLLRSWVHNWWLDASSAGQVRQHRRHSMRPCLRRQVLLMRHYCGAGRWRGRGTAGDVGVLVKPGGRLPREALGMPCASGTAGTSVERDCELRSSMGQLRKSGSRLQTILWAGPPSRE